MTPTSRPPPPTPSPSTSKFLHHGGRTCCAPPVAGSVLQRGGRTGATETTVKNTWLLGNTLARAEVRALQSCSRTGSRPSVTRVGGVCLNCARGSAGPAFPMPISCRPRVRGRHCFAGGGPRNLGAQCAGYSHRLETEHEKLAAVVGGANTRVNWGQDHPRFSWCGTGVRLRLGLRWLRLVWFDSTRPCVVLRSDAGTKRSLLLTVQTRMLLIKHLNLAARRHATQNEAPRGHKPGSFASL